MAIKSWLFNDLGDVLSTTAIANNNRVWTDVGLIPMTTATSDDIPVWTSIGELPPSEIQ